LTSLGDVGRTNDNEALHGEPNIEGVLVTLFILDDEDDAAILTIGHEDPFVSVQR
jgi:hypothetical protein